MKAQVLLSVSLVFSFICCSHGGAMALLGKEHSRTNCKIQKNWNSSLVRLCDFLSERHSYLDTEFNEPILTFLDEVDRGSLKPTAVRNLDKIAVTIKPKSVMRFLLSLYQQANGTDNYTVPFVCMLVYPRCHDASAASKSNGNGPNDTVIFPCKSWCVEQAVSLGSDALCRNLTNDSRRCSQKQSVKTDYSDLLAKSLTIDEDDVSALLVTEEASESANDSEILPAQNPCEINLMSSLWITCAVFLGMFNAVTGLHIWLSIKPIYHDENKHILRVFAELCAVSFVYIIICVYMYLSELCHSYPGNVTVWYFCLWSLGTWRATYWYIALVYVWRGLFVSYIWPLSLLFYSLMVASTQPLSIHPDMQALYLLFFEHLPGVILVMVTTAVWLHQRRTTTRQTTDRQTTNRQTNAVSVIGEAANCSSAPTSPSVMSSASTTQLLNGQTPDQVSKPKTARSLEEQLNAHSVDKRYCSGPELRDVGIAEDPPTTPYTAFTYTVEEEDSVLKQRMFKAKQNAIMYFRQRVLQKELANASREAVHLSPLRLSDQSKSVASLVSFAEDMEDYGAGDSMADIQMCDDWPTIPAPIPSPASAYYKAILRHNVVNVLDEKSDVSGVSTTSDYYSDVRRSSQYTPIPTSPTTDETDHYVNMLSPRKTSPQTVEVDTQAAITNKEIQEDHIQPKDLEIQGSREENDGKIRLFCRLLCSLFCLITIMQILWEDRTSINFVE